MPTQIRFQLAVRQGPEAGVQFDLAGKTVTIGRHSSNDISIADTGVSRDHARLQLADAAYTIEDLGSTNGTFVNGVLITGPHPLADGDIVDLGSNVSLSFQVVVDMDATETVIGIEVPARSDEPKSVPHLPTKEPAETPGDVMEREGAEGRRARRQGQKEKRRNLGGCLAQAWTVLGVVATCAGLTTFILLEGPQAAKGFAYNTLKLPVQLPCNKATAEENLILVTDFEQAGVMADRRIYRDLIELVDTLELDDVRVEHLEGWTATNSQEAIGYGNRCNATAVVWGFADTVGMEAHFTFMEPGEREEDDYEAPDLRVSVAATDIGSYATFLEEFAPNQIKYTLLVYLGQVKYVTGDYLRSVVLLSEALDLELGETDGILDVYRVYYYRGDSFTNLEEYENALDDLEHAIELNPK